LIKIDLAFQNAFVGAAFGLPIVFENEQYTPTAGRAYAELKVLQNDVSPATLNDSNDSDGVFRVILRYPVDTGAFDAKTKADQIFAVFAIGARLIYDGVTVIIMRNSRQPGLAEDGWYKLVLDMPYRANFAR
jgi:hypothetical protein